MTSVRAATAAGQALQALDYAYDAGHDVTSITDGVSGASQTFEYDDVGRLVHAVGAYGEERYEYDAAGNLLRKGSLVFAIDPAHPHQVTCGVDLDLAQAEANGIVNNPHLVACTDALLQPARRLSSDARGQVDVIRARGVDNNPNIARSFDVEYDALGNVVRKNGTRYAYDAENRLVRVVDATGRIVEENVYDTAGQRIVQRTPSGTTVFIDGIYEEGPTHASRHVRAGDLLVATVTTPRTAVRLATAVPELDVPACEASGGGCATSGRGGSGVALVPAVLLAWLIGRRDVRRRVRAMLRELAVTIRRRAREAAVVAVVVPAYLLATAQPVRAEVQPSNPPEQRFYYHANHLGSVNVVTDDRGAVIARREYRPFGDSFAWSGAQEGPREVLQTFGGHRYDDDTSLYYLGARHYDPVMGRFLTADTQVPDPLNPRTLNRYAFAGGNPVRYVDPSGHSWLDVVIGVVVIVAVVVVSVVTLGAGAVIAGLVIGAALGLAVGVGVAIARGYSFLSVEFWETVVTGVMAGAVIGAGVGLAIGGLAGTVAITGSAQYLAAMALAGAATGALETTITLLWTGGSPEQILRGFLISIGVGAAIGLVFGVMQMPVPNVGTAWAKAAIKASIAASAKMWWKFFQKDVKDLAKKLFPGLAGTIDKAGATSTQRSGLTSSSDASGSGLPPWAFDGVWGGGADPDRQALEASLLETLPVGS